MPTSKWDDAAIFLLAFIYIIILVELLLKYLESKCILAVCSISFNYCHVLDEPSESPKLTGYTDGDILYEGDANRAIECTQSGGNPLSDITWSCFGLSSEDTSTDAITISSVSLPPDRNYNQEICVCIATHPDPTVAYTASTSVTITVYCKSYRLPDDHH